MRNSSQDGTEPPAQGQIKPPAEWPVPDWKRHQVLELMGSGGVGRVFKAWDPRLRRMIAIKLLHSEDADSVSRLLREARAQAQLVHPNICQVYEAGMAGDHPYIAMQLIRGHRLDAVANRMSLRERVAVIRDIAGALATAHRMNLIHRDIKPSNIMVERADDGGWHPYLLDFGLSRNRWIGDERPRGRSAPSTLSTDSTVPMALTGAGHVVGTPGYMAPEQAMGHTRILGERADLFSLGATLYTILAGEPPFRGETPAEVLEQVVRTDPNPLHHVNRSIPADLAAIVHRCLAKEPGERYPSSAAVEADLRSFLENQPVSAVRPTLSYVAGKLVKRHPLAAVTLAGVIVTIGTLGTLWLQERWSASRRALAAARMGHLVSKVDALMWRARTAPLHDIRPHTARVRELMRRIEQEAATGGGATRSVGHLALGEAYLALRDLDEAKTHLLAAWEEGYRTPDGAFAVARCLVGLYRRDLEALDHVRDQELRVARKREIEALYGRELTEWRGRIPNRPGTPLKLLDAELAYCHGRIEQGIRAAREVLEIAPWNYEALLLTGDLHLKQAEVYQSLTENWFSAIERARSSFAAAIDLAPSDPDCYLAAAAADLFVYEHCRVPGKRMRKLGLIEDGLGSVEAALTCNPRSANALRIRSRLLQAKAGQSETLDIPWRKTAHEAVEVAGRVVELAPEDPESHQCLGDALLMRARLGTLHGDDVETDIERAITALRRVEELRGSFAAHLALGIAYRRLATYRILHGLPRAEEALESAAHSLEEGLKYRPNDPSAWHNLGRVYHTRARLAARSGDDPERSFRRSEAAFDRAIGADPERAVPLNSLGNLRTDMARWLLRSGRPCRRALQQAVSAFEEAMEVAPRYAFAANNLAAVLVLQANLKIARGEDPTSDLDRADRLLGLALQWRKGYGTPLFNRGTLHRSRAEYLVRCGADPGVEFRTAVGMFMDGLKRRKNVAEAEAKLGEAYLAWAESRLEKGRPADTLLQEGAAWITRALEHDPSLAEGWRYRLYRVIVLGEEALRNGGSMRGLHEPAAQALAAAKRFDPSHPELLRLTARLLLLRAHEAGRDSAERRRLAREGLSLLKTLLEGAEPGTRTLVLAARLHMLEGDPGGRVEARRLLERATAMDQHLVPEVRRLLATASPTSG